MVERRLGRGLDFLLSGDLKSETPEEITEVELTEIAPNPYQPRHEFTEDELDELASSIAEHGVLQPVILRRTRTGFQLVAGERRVRASHKAGRTSVPALVREANDTQMLEIALIENLQREDLGAMEVARGYAAYIERLGLTQQQAATRLGKSRSALANTLRLLDLPPDIQELVSRGTLTAGHARALLALTDPEVQRALARRIVKERLSVRQVEKLVRGGARATSPRTATAQSAHLAELEDRLKTHLGTKVAVRSGRGERGKIVIDYFSSDELGRLLAVLMPEPTL